MLKFSLPTTIRLDPENYIFCYNFATKKKNLSKTEVFCSGGPTRTDDLRVMSPTSYQLLHLAIYR